MNKDAAVTSFVLGILCVIPLLNWVLAPLAMYFGIRALRSIRKDPQHYGGKTFAIIGITLGSAVLFFNVTGKLFWEDDALYPDYPRNVLMSLFS
ncbi:TPA: DUF4190 domain-containing protein [Candidatus Woesearchaeota archaeon]|nr:MAG: hypothetical protein QT04_C0010G0015 [archaeon GW2011_AR11]HIH91513.1 DUF4190 domain-containing protein [Candidatus Woesearchaeota archaeon]HII64023.1 DUF4190 domain-containing protein [Candidatus Woesearchaeota archaeon]